MIEDIRGESASYLVDRKLGMDRIKAGNPDLENMFDRGLPKRGDYESTTLLTSAGFDPHRTDEAHFEFLKSEGLIPEEHKDGMGLIRVYRGDWQNLEKKGIFSTPFSIWGDNLGAILQNVSEEDLPNVPGDNALEKWMYMHANSNGYGPFLSAFFDRYDAVSYPKANVPATSVYEIIIPWSMAFVNYMDEVSRAPSVLIPDLLLPMDLRPLKLEELGLGHGAGGS